jgi:hypothetical protein
VICQEPSGSRDSVAAAKLQLPADASMTLRWRDRTAEGPMPRVHKHKSKAEDLYDEAAKSRKRTPSKACSRFVLAASVSMIAFLMVQLDQQTVICQVPSGSRDSVAAAKLQLPADASMTLRWRAFKQA